MAIAAHRPFLARALLAHGVLGFMLCLPGAAMTASTQELYIDLRKTDLLIAECRHHLECQYRLISNLRQQRALAWREKLRARDMEKRMSALCTHRDALVRAVAAEQQRTADKRHGVTEQTED
jgi:hypothetical protein